MDIPRLIAPLALAGALLVGTSAPAVADDAEPSEITWSVAPADSSGPDGRHWVELELDPGASVVEHLAVRNLSDRAVTFALAAADGYFTPTGRFSMLEPGTESVAAGTWITLADSVTVPAREAVVVPFTVTVPATAEPGDHAAGVAASVLSSGTDGSGGNVGVVSRFGFRVMTRVTGAVTPSFDVVDARGDYTVVWNPFVPGEVRVGFDVVNTGNVRLQVAGTVAVGGVQADVPGPGEAVAELLPGETRHLETTLAHVWPLVRRSVTVTVSPSLVTPLGLEPVAVGAVERQVGVWTPPIPQLCLLAGVALIAGGLIQQRRHSRRKLAVLLDAARAEGRLEATTGAPEQRS